MSAISTFSLATRLYKSLKATGLTGPDHLIREIVDQAEGRPGLAVTLAHLCLQGGVHEVALGDALNRSFLRFFESVDRQAIEILAAFSVGGDTGLPMQIVAKELGLNLAAVRNSVTKLAAGGVIREIDQHRLSVRPSALREVLVRNIFFAGATSLPIEALLAEAPSLPEVARTLIGAKARGARINQALLARVLEQADSGIAWGEFASLGHDEATWILQRHADKLIAIARPALRHAPEMTIPLLLTAAVGDHRQPHSTPSHPLRLIADWVHASLPGRGHMVEQRKILFQSANNWLISGGDVHVTLQVFQSVLSPKFEYGTTDPGMGLTWTMHFGYPSVAELLAIEELWSKVLEALKMLDILDWEPVFQIVEAWSYPGRVNVSIPPEMHDAMTLFAGRMLSDIVLLSATHPGILHRAAQIAKAIGLEVEIPLDANFDILYPVEDLENWKSAEERQVDTVRRLADQWSDLDPAWVVEQIISIEREARSAHIEWPRWTPLLCAEIAPRTALPNIWIQALVDSSAPSDLMAPFLHRAAAISQSGWVDLALTCLEQPSLRWAAVSVVLTLPEPPEDLLAAALQQLDAYAQTVMVLCMRNQISEQLVKRLLHHQRCCDSKCCRRRRMVC